MNKRYAKPLGIDELAKLGDAEIDTSDIPELDKAFWDNAKIVAPKNKPVVSLRLSENIIEHFKQESPKGYTARMAAVLSAYVDAQK
jgi:uncharacterized protein (DUF4415 family)